MDDPETSKEQKKAPRSGADRAAEAPAHHAAHEHENARGAAHASKGSPDTKLFYGIFAAIVVIAVVAAVIKLLSPGISASVSLSTNTVVTYPYQTSYFSVRVDNTGKTSISKLVIGFYLNGNAVHYSTVDVPAGSSNTVYENYTYQAGGNYSFSAIADPAHVANMKDRNNAQSSLEVQIQQPESPDIYTSLPNVSIAYTHSFTMSGRGLIASAATAEGYNVSVYTDMFSPAKNVLTKLFENLYVFVAYVNGAYVRYSDNRTASAIWLQGTLQAPLVGYVLSTFHFNQSNYTMNGTEISYAKVNNQTSICYLYTKGWTKIFTYYNASADGSCKDFAGSYYAPDESNAIVAQIKANKNLTKYQSGFFYTNSTTLGSGLSLSDNSGLAGLIVFQNQYGFFTSYIQNTSAFSETAPTCKGMLATYGNTSICSVYVAPSSNSTQGFGMVNTTELTGNYRISLYSLVNQSNLLAAHQNGASLINALHITPSIEWKSAFVSTCAIDNASIGCNVMRFDYYNSTAYLRIENRLANALTINTFSCYSPGLRQNETVGVQVASNSTASITARCYNIPVGGIASAYTDYALSMNYTYSGITQTVTGLLNVTNPGLR